MISLRIVSLYRKEKPMSENTSLPTNKLVIRPSEAARITGLSAAFIREIIRRKIIDIGRVVPPRHEKGGNRYLVYTNKLFKELGALEGIYEEAGGKKAEPAKTEQDTD